MGSLPPANYGVSTSGHNRGGWITFPFLTATMAGLTLAAGGWVSNLMVYMIGEFHVKSVDSAEIWSAVNGCTTMFPIIGAIMADSYLGSFSVIWISSLISLLGIVLLLLTATIDSLRPPPCASGSSSCITPSEGQLAVLYTALTLAILGLSGTRFTIGTMGADQFAEPRQQRTFWNWFLFTLYTSSAISTTAIVYVEDHVSWGWGYGLCAMTNVIGLVVFLVGNKFYRHVKPEGSPFMGLARVIVAAIGKRNYALPSVGGEDCYYHHKSQNQVAAEMAVATPTKDFKFLNRAALKTEGDTQADGSIAKPWKLCTVQQVEELKTLIRIFPLWSSGIFLSTPLAIQASLITLQALTMDRHIGPNFTIPAGSMLVFILVSTSISIAVIDRLLLPFWKKLTNRPLTPLQRIGIGHVTTVVSMVVSALVESKRLEKAKSQNGSSVVVVPLSVLWLVPQLALAGAGEAFHFPGNIEFFYREFPSPLKSTSTALVAFFIGIAFYLSTAVMGLVRRVTRWLPDDINGGGMDNVYWVLGVVGLVNFGYYLVCAWFYRHHDVEKVVEDDDDSSGSDR